MRVLVVKMSSMGDIVHAQPIVSDLCANVPGVVVDWVAEAPFASIPAMTPGVSSVLPIAWRKWRRSLGDAATRAAIRAFRDRLRAERYDWVIDCQGLLKSAALTRLARTAHRVGPSWSSAREPLASLAYDHTAKVPWALHVVERNRAIAAAAFGYALDAPAHFGLSAPGFDLPGLPAGAGYAVLIPGASRVEKLWPESSWIEIGRLLASRGLRLAWLWGSRDEQSRVRRLAGACGDVVDAESARPEDVRPAPETATSCVPAFLSVSQAAGLLARARLVVGLDTGFTHLAGALGRPTIGIFCDFDATQCAVTGDARCESFGGVGQTPTPSAIGAAIERMLPTDPELDPR